jgi:hypothetical protein
MRESQPKLPFSTFVTAKQKKQDNSKPEPSGRPRRIANILDCRAEDLNNLIADLQKGKLINE